MTAQLRDVNGQYIRQHDLEMSNAVAAIEARFAAHEKLMDERDVHGKELREAQDKAVAAAFSASETAIGKAEDSQRAYNTSHNDLLRKQEAMIPRPEFDAAIKALDEKVTATQRWLAGLVITVLLAVAGLLLR